MTTDHQHIDIHYGPCSADRASYSRPGTSMLAKPTLHILCDANIGATIWKGEAVEKNHVGKVSQFLEAVHD